ncbi:MAG: hypothetical protein VYA51_12685 [Planctomycetota bacterium]|nr:hypothetical protein [Planctomycetota bacterium]
MFGLLYGGAAASPPAFTATMPPANWSDSSDPARTMGRTMAHLSLHYWLLGTGYYVWYNHGTTPDPAIASPAELSGRTGIEVTLAAGARTAEQVATATATAIDAVSGLSASSTGADVTVVGAASASAGGTSFDARGREGILGTPDDRALTLNSFAAPTLRASLLNAADWSSEEIVITGFTLGVGDTHDAGIVIAIYQGGSADDDFDGATLLGHVGTTAGDATTSQAVRVQSSGVYVNPALGRVWVALMHSTGQAEMAFTWYSQNSATGNNWITTGNDAIHLMTAGPASSSAGDLPATLGTVASSEIGMPAIQLSFVQADSFQSDMHPTFDFGTQHAVVAGQRDTTQLLPGSSDDALVVGNSYNVPSDMRGLYMHRSGICYDTHVDGSDYCAHVGVGGAAVDDFSGASVYQVGQTSGTATGWNYVAASAQTIPLAAGTRIWLLIEFDASGSALSFDPGTPNIFEDEHFGPAVWYNGPASESEYAPLSNPLVSPGQETTNLDYDPAGDGLQAANSLPGPWTITPNGTNFQPGNNVGTHGTARTFGFAVAS